jgi:methionyl-tRNA formyltransferase
VKVEGLRAGFAGTPDFAAAALAALADAGFTIPLVLTQPDRPHGRGLATAASPVKRLAQARHLAVSQPATLKDAAARASIADARLDVVVVAAYGLIRPRAGLDLPRLGCINVHASLLPRWRGAAPVARAIEAGDATTGISIMQMDEGLDTGGVLAAEAVAIDARESAGTLTAKLAALGARMIVAALERLARGEALVAAPQPAQGATYARKVTRDEARIDWQRAAAAIDRAVRAFDPWPAAWTTQDGSTVKLWRASALTDAQGSSAAPGSIVRVQPSGIDVACGEGVLRIDEVQPANAKRMPAAAFAAGRALAAGDRFT